MMRDNAIACDLCGKVRRRYVVIFAQRPPQKSVGWWEVCLTCAAVDGEKEWSDCRVREISVRKNPIMAIVRNWMQ